MSKDNVKKLIGDVFNEIADAIQSGSFAPKVKVGLTTLGSEHGLDEVIKAAEMATNKYNDFEVVLIGPKSNTSLTTYEVTSEKEAHEKMESLLDSEEIKGCVTMHYNFPIGVSTVGRVITPALGHEMIIATTTGTSSTNRVEGMVKNAIYGIIAAKSVGIKDPKVGILNVDGARQVERALTELKSNGYDISFTESMRSDGGIVMRGNDLLTGTPDVMVTDSLTGNILMKMFSSFTTGGSYEASGYGYGPGIGEGYNRLVNIISRASGAPVICEALRYCASCAQNNIIDISKNEFASLNKAGFKELCEKITSSDKKAAASENEVVAPTKKVVTNDIPGVDILDLEDSVKELWKAGIYAESGMGCTGPIVLVATEDKDKAIEILKEKEYIG
ncbi:glycine/sarcosine/betaine reductase complex component C subunit alpha [Clostridium cylindrosporum]|uniref:phosphate acyltransferase n=1 Tax=Clostridium cylindrosporum DSM 605 TaxID=1121307 RepID=A0A0J8D4R4_CLOCY|nr:glycine/sarcosine/betaine reductase complex component C subunit alpha [Clostridium cylindrosporum]KMT20807.1 glycine/sarcosine/betaine reductase complex component C subunit alpha [Clostridium cylindrosporum DSM 605]